MFVDSAKLLRHLGLVGTRESLVDFEEMSIQEVGVGRYNTT
jgi:hypothetical protein